MEKKAENHLDHVDHLDQGPLSRMLRNFPSETATALQDLSLSEFEQGTYVVKVKSHLLGEDIYFVSNEKLFNRVPDGFVTYTGKELKALAAQESKGMTREELKKVHDVKKSMDGEVLDP